MNAPDSFKSLLGARCLQDSERLRPYEVPERGTPGRAACVLLPESEEEVGAILLVANEQSLKLVISAGRTGLVEAQRPDGESVLSLERLRRIGEIDASGRSVIAQAGVTIDALNEALQPHNLFWPIEMGSSSAATVGACVANGSAGANAVCYGTAAHLCEAAWGYWGSSEPAGPCAAPGWRTPPANQLAIDSARLHPEWGLVGGQGSLGVITRVKLRLHPIPAQREAALIPADGMPAAMDILAAARVEFGGDVEEFEFISRTALELVKALKGASLRLPFSREPDAPFFLLLQIKSHDDADLVSRLYAFLAKELCLPDERIGYAPLAVLKSIRHSITEASNARARQLGGGRLTFDTATPVAVLGEYLKELASQIARTASGVQFVAFGHAGVGGAHLHLLGSRDQPIGEQADELIKLVFDVTQRCGGTFSAEHGVGAKWSEEFLRRTPAPVLQEMIAAKRARDPRNVLNPRCLGFNRLLIG